MRRLLLVCVVVSLVALGGCLDDIDDGDDLEVVEDDAADGGDAVGADDDTGSDDTDDASETGGTDDANGATDADGSLELHHIDVGQADATLLVAPGGETMLIDTGDWRDDGEPVIAYLEAQGIDRIDHLVATHAHADHIGGHAALIEHFEEHGDGIGAAYDSGVAHDTQTYENYLDAIEAFDVELFEVIEGDELPFDGVDVTVLNPPAEDGGTDLHYNSVTLAIEFGEFRYLTTGDAEADAEERLLEAWPDELEADLYHAGHHGSSTSSTEPFVSAVAPEMTVISSAFESQFGHPHDEVLERFADHGVETYWTGIHGDIVFVVDGAGDVSVETDADEPTDADEIAALAPDGDDESYSLSPDGWLAPPAASSGPSALLGAVG